MFDKLIDFLLGWIQWFKFWTICHAEHAGFVRRFGQPKRDLKPGWNWVLPCIETSTMVDMRAYADVLPVQSLRTGDGVDLVVRLMVSHRVADPRTFVLEVYDANVNLQDIAAGCLGKVVQSADASAVLSGAILKKVEREVRKAAKAWGMEILRVQFVDCAPMTSIRLLGVRDDPA